MFITKVNFNTSTARKHEHLKTIQYLGGEERVQLNKEGMPYCTHEYFLLDVPLGSKVWIDDSFTDSLHGKEVFLATRATCRLPFH